MSFFASHLIMKLKLDYRAVKINDCKGDSESICEASYKVFAYVSLTTLKPVRR
uniref:Uncharacterized protein n=1 Tax=Solanum tuberosum TaxID=4113 RepID=M1CKP6_SOLTU